MAAVMPRQDVSFYLPCPLGLCKEFVRSRNADFPKLSDVECVHALKGMGLPRSSHSSEIALAGSRRLRSTLAAAPVCFAHALVTVAQTKKCKPLVWSILQRLKISIDQ